MSDHTPNLLLIGMPGSGKSTIGVLLAKELSFDFIDTDVLIQRHHQMSLQEIVDSQGHLALRKIEETELLKLNATRSVIATGGSAVYSRQAMAQLKQTSVSVFLKISLETMHARIGTDSTRGLAKSDDQSLEELYHERMPLYETHADIVIECNGLNHRTTCEIVARKFLAHIDTKATSNEPT